MIGGWCASIKDTRTMGLQLTRVMEQKHIIVLSRNMDFPRNIGRVFVVMSFSEIEGLTFGDKKARPRGGAGLLLARACAKLFSGAQ